MEGTGGFLTRYAGRGVLFFILTIVLLRLSGADPALAQNSGKWSVVASPNVGGGQNYLYGVTAITPNDVWAVGTSATATLTEHWNGTQWSVVASPSIGTYYPTLFSVAAIATNNVWAVGQLYNLQQAATYHSDGTGWSEIANPTLPFSQLSGVAVTPAGCFWAVGSYSPPQSNNRTLIEFYC